MPVQAKSYKAEGHHSIGTHLIIRGADRAIDFYKQVFGATELSRMAGPDGKIMHAELKFGDSIVMICDEFPKMDCLSPQSLNGSPVTLHFYSENVDHVFDRAVKAGATVTMPVMDMFWGDRYGKFKDPFGHSWSVATHMWDMTPDELRQAATDAMKQMQAGGGCQ